MREPLAHTARASRIAGGEAPAWIRWARDLGIAATAGVFLALVGAMGTSDMPLLTRLAYWVPLMLVGGLAGHLVSVAIARIPLARTNPWVFGVLEAIILSIPLTLMVWGYTNLLFDGDMLPPALPYLFGAVLVISAAMTAIMMLASQPGRVTHAPPAGATASPVRFLERLPPKLMGAAIYAVSSEDHFLRLHTSKGSDLILMRLADAIGELEGLEGAQTHRSWWVAREAVESARREGDRLVLALKGGAEAPVSRPNVKALRDAGWF
ncbi:MAG: LytTR family transcriptional regulator DNA-binding domain-containing protein [Phycisphaerales bacterium]|nr:LytTR family transcriptional regulator DNA-binding domain-containing protein [Hyphomonadaceae bacterium]